MKITMLGCGTSVGVPSLGILGWGCLIWAGGPFSWLDHVGHENVVVECQGLSDQYGSRFAPPKIIKKLASSGRKFYN